MTGDFSAGFSGRVAMVTGAGAGLGRAHARGLAAGGARVVVCDRDAAAAGAVADEIAQAGGRALAAGCDVTDPVAVAAAVDAARHDIRVNTLAPTAATGMTEGLITPDEAALLDPALVTPGLLYLVHQDAPSRMILGAGAGVFAVTRITETRGLWLPPEARTPAGIAVHMDRISDPEGAATHMSALEQTRHFVERGGGGP